MGSRYGRWPCGFHDMGGGSSSGDSVLVACGTYSASLLPIGMKSGVILVSETGEADCVTIHSEFWAISCTDIDATACIIGFTFTECSFSALRCSNSTVTIDNCTFFENHAYVAVPDDGE